MTLQMPSSVSPILGRWSQQPVLIGEGQEQFVLSCMNAAMADPRMNAEICGTKFEDVSTEEEDQRAAADADYDFWGSGDKNDWRSYYRPYNVANGILQIPIMGTLVDKVSMIFGRWMTGYKYIEMALKRGLADSNVRGIALVIDSPGGEVSGCFELAEKIYEARSEKVIRSYAANSAYSAAFALGSAGTTLTVAKSGGVGSVGVVTAHVSYQKMLENAGIDVTFIFAGAHKVDGNPYEKLSASAKARISKRINKIYGVFTSTVAKQRGMDEDDVRATEALTYDADEALEVNFADKIGSIEEELTSFAEDVNGDEEDEFMTTPTNGNTPGSKPENTTTGIDQAAHDRAVAEAHAAGAAAAVTRIAAIRNSEVGKKRPTMALNLATTTSMSAAEAEAFMASMPEEGPAPAAQQQQQATQPAPAVEPKVQRNHFNETMNNSPHPDITPEATDGAAADTDEAKTEFLLNSYGLATGIARKKRA